MLPAARLFFQVRPALAAWALFAMAPAAVHAQLVPASVPAVYIHQILEAHNVERCVVEPAAEAMPAMQWDQVLATVARSYAATCPTGHNEQRTSDYAELGGRGYVGENMVFATLRSSMPAMMRAMVREKFEYSYEPHPRGHYPVGHYTQMIWSGTTRVGCGQAICGNEKILVCNYSPGGNIIGRYPYPSTTDAQITTAACAVAPAPAPTTASQR